MPSQTVTTGPPSPFGMTITLDEGIEVNNPVTLNVTISPPKGPTVDPVPQSFFDSLMSAVIQAILGRGVPPPPVPPQLPKVPEPELEAFGRQFMQDLPVPQNLPELPDFTPSFTGFTPDPEVNITNPDLPDFTLDPQFDINFSLDPLSGLGTINVSPNFSDADGVSGAGGVAGTGGGVSGGDGTGGVSGDGAAGGP